MLRRQVSPDEAPAVNWFLCVCFTGMGLYIVALALGWIYIDPKEIHVPRWVLTLVGVVFVLAGLQPVASQIGLVGRRARVMLAALVVTFMVVGTWVVFHQDELPTQGSSSSASRVTGSLIRIQSSHRLWPKEYDPLMTVVLWDLPMGAFALWLLFGGRRKNPE